MMQLTAIMSSTPASDKPTKNSHQSVRAHFYIQEADDNTPLPWPSEFSSTSPSEASATNSVSVSSEPEEQLTEEQPRSLPTYKLVGDNIDKELRPYHMRSDYQT